MTNSPLDDLRSVFGAFSHEAPAAPVADPEYPPPPEVPGDDDLPDEPVFSPLSGLLLEPSARFDGDPDSSPWNVAEPVLWRALQIVDIEHVEERVLDGLNGVFWGRVRYPDGGDDSFQVPIKSVLVKFGGPPKPWIYEAWGSEYLLEDRPSALLERELAAYEVAKACGMEDLVPPMVSKEVDVVRLLSDAARERIASVLRVSPLLVDETLGIAAIVQLYPKNSDNFLETWASLGATCEERWKSASDRLRHAMYRAFILDFVLGVQDRMLASYLYNKTTDRLAILDMGLCFPHPGFSAEKYMRARQEGWGRAIRNGFEKPMETWPAHSCDLSRVIGELGYNGRKELVQTIQQVTGAINEEVGAHLVRVLASFEIPIQGIVGAVMRLAYAAADPEALAEKPMDFIRNVAMPLRKGMGTDEHRIETVVQKASAMLAAGLGEEVDIIGVMQEELPDTSSLLL